MAVPVTKGEELELHVDSLAYGGNGVARLDGFVVFVRRGLPGDTVRARVTKVKRSHAEAIALDVIAPGADGDALLRRLPQDLHDRFGIGHCTVQLETGETAHACALRPEHVI